MKKLVLLAMVIGSSVLVKAQDFKKVSNAVLIRQMETAKGELDKIMADPKAQAKPEGWFWKAMIYASFYNDEVLKGKYPNAYKIADEAYDKYIALDPTAKLLKENNGADLVFKMYKPAFNSGVGSFNKKDWDSAAYYFGYSVKYTDILFQNKFNSNKEAAFDTTSILYAGFSAQNAKKPELAMKYYSKLIDSKVSGESYIDIYKFPLINAINSKDEAAFNKYLAIAKLMYPKTNWEDYELSYFNQNYSLADKAAMYDKEDAAGTMSVNKYIEYAQAFANLTKEEKATVDSVQQIKYLIKGTDAFAKAATKKPDDGIWAFNAGITYYNLYGIYDDQSRAYKRALQELNSNRVVEKDPKKKAAADAKYKEQADLLKKQKADLEKPMADAGEATLVWLEKSYSLLKDKPSRTTTEKNCLNKSVDCLSNIYAIKRDKARGTDPKGFDLYDAKYKLYDELHGKF
ncbi:hypothetical protein [Parasediminibacterium sp. JCM 36343]|uniref:hypothetical protein n=1 Tax=Parasediminibacterium sp. JCM 36343 TaxID=3374279 RepID=UPI00397A0AA7